MAITSPFIFLTILCFSMSVILLSASAALVLNLMHPNQIHSLEPPHVSGIRESSATRLGYLQAKANGDIFAKLSPFDTSSFMVNISIGSPPSMQLLHIDTGSDLLWLQCRPCLNCYTQILPFFEPARSRTYRNISCTTTRYSIPSLTFDAKTRSCGYVQEYMDDSMSKGTLATETLVFNTIYGESSSASLPDVVFGCSHDTTSKAFQGTGVLGLGYGRLSLVRRFGSKFSYCLGSLDDPSYAHNVLVIGDTGANILGDTTSLEIEDGLYYVGVDAISVDGVLLPIDPWVFQRTHPNRLSGTLIDTGTTLTILAREAYEPLKNRIEDIFDGRFETVHLYQEEKIKPECYNGNFERDLVDSGFPTITISFSDGAELSLDVYNVFSKDAPDVFCLGFALNTEGDYNIIGAMAQQSYNVGYDLKAKKISFERIDCGVLFDN